MQLTYTGIIYAGGVQGGGKSGLVPCLSRCWRGPTVSPDFYKPSVPGAPAHTGVGKEPTIMLCGPFYSALSRGHGGRRPKDHDLCILHMYTQMSTWTYCSQPQTLKFSHSSW